MSRDKNKTFIQPVAIDPMTKPGGGAARARASGLVPAQEGARSPARRHTWILDVLGDLHRYATREGLTGFAAAINDTGETLLEEIFALAEQDLDNGQRSTPSAPTERDDDRGDQPG